MNNESNGGSNGIPSNEEKLDQILAELQEIKKALDSQNSLDKSLEEAKEYMMKYHNIRWISDDLEEDVYDVIIAVIKRFL